MGPLLTKGAAYLLRSRLGQYIILKLVEALVGAIQEWQARQAAQKRNEEIEKAAQELKRANEIKDTEERLNAKADALCKLEKLSNPNSTCDK